MLVYQKVIFGGGLFPPPFSEKPSPFLTHHGSPPIFSPKIPRRFYFFVAEYRYFDVELVLPPEQLMGHQGAWGDPDVKKNKATSNLGTS